MSNAPAIEVDGLVVHYSGAANPAVDGVSFGVDSGSVLALLGPNGAGKTSTVEVLEGLRSSTGGSVRVLGLDPIRDARALMPRIGVMLQRNGVYPTLNARQVVSLFAAYYGTRARNADELIESVGLNAVAATPWRRLSGGEQQRVSLALALVGRPEVAFLDEPTAGLDPAARSMLWDRVRDLRATGTTVLLTTHYLDEAERLADRVVIVDHGRVVANGSPAELRESAADGISFSARAGLNVAELGAALGAPANEHSAGEYRVEAVPTPQAVAALTAWLASQGAAVGDLRAGRQRLEDVYLRLTQDAASSEPNPDHNAGRRSTRRSRR